MRFDKKVVLVTGGSRGIGAEIVKLFAKEGAEVIINYVSHEDSAKAVLKEISNKGNIIQADISNQDDVKRMFEEIRKTYGRIDILVNNAGVVSSKPFKELTLEAWNRTYATNITGMFLCAQQAISLMGSGGSIINISSLRGIPEQGRPPIMDYSTSKAAVISFTKTLAKELAPSIRVNCVAPGMTTTDIAKGYTKEQLDKFIESIYLKRLIDPKEVANAVIFLASTDASGITGVVLSVDGGQSLSK